MRNVFDLASRLKPEFTDLEKTALGDIAMDFRTQGLPVRLYINPTSKTALAKFFNFITGDEYLFVTKHRERNVVQYKVSHGCGRAENYINFKDVLIDCKNSILSQGTSPERMRDLNMQDMEIKKGFGLFAYIHVAR